MGNAKKYGLIALVAFATIVITSRVPQLRKIASGEK